MIGHMSSIHPTSDSTTKPTVSATLYGFDPTAGSDSCIQPGEERRGEERDRRFGAEPRVGLESARRSLFAGNVGGSKHS